jgi:hypothetical protein
VTRAEPAGARAGVEPFVRHHQRYDDWFERHHVAYLSELLAVRALLPWGGRGLEIGVGTGGASRVPWGSSSASIRRPRC